MTRKYFLKMMGLTAAVPFVAKALPAPRTCASEVLAPVEFKGVTHERINELLCEDNFYDPGFIREVSVSMNEDSTYNYRRCVKIKRSEVFG